MELFRQLEPPYERFEPSMLGPEFPRELEVVSRPWFACGYRQGIAAYLNFFLLREVIETHDTAFPPRFRTFRSMADSFYQTDLFIRDVTDSGMKPTGGISSPAVRGMLEGMMKRHRRISIPEWMMTYFGFSLLEMVEKQVGVRDPEEKRLHLAYMAKAYRIMGMRFSEDRGRMERFSRAIEREQAGATPQLEQHARNILLLGEMAGVSSRWEEMSAMLPEATREALRGVYPKVAPGPLARVTARALGRVLMKKAVGAPRKAVPVTAARDQSP